MEEAENFDRIAILDDGKLIAHEKPDKLKKMVGRSVLVMESDHADDLVKSLRKFYGEAVSQVNGSVRIEKENSEDLIGPIMRDHGNIIQSITVKKPSLEDAFIHLTGHEFRAGSESVT